MDAACPILGLLRCRTSLCLHGQPNKHKSWSHFASSPPWGPYTITANLSSKLVKKGWQQRKKLVDSFLTKMACYVSESTKTSVACHPMTFLAAPQG